MTDSRVFRQHAQQRVTLALLMVAGAPMYMAPSRALAQWPQWGGPNRDFHSSATGLAEVWSDTGPKKLWERPLGEGCSSIVADAGRLYTMYRNGEDEAVVALKAETGAIEWEHKYPGWKQPNPLGKGPHSTPAIEGDMIYTLGRSGLLCALNKNSGKVAWSHDLVKEYKVKPPGHGFSASPLAYKGSLILPVGGPEYGVAAFALADGKLIWHKHDFTKVYSSPILINVGGEDQIALAASDRVVGLDPKTGDLLWSMPMENREANIISTPIWGPDGFLFVTCAQFGSVGLKLSKTGSETKVEKVWTNDKLQVSLGTAVRIGDFIFGSSGTSGPHFVTAINAKTGEVAWQERGFGKANLIHADGKILLLDDEGVLVLATAGPEGWEVKSKVNVLKGKVYTAPTLVDKTLYLRDQEKILALDLRKAT